MTIRSIDIKNKKNFAHEKIPLLAFKVLDVSYMKKILKFLKRLWDWGMNNEKV